LMLRALM